MQKNVLEYLLNTADKTPDATAYVDEDKHLTFREVVDLSKIIGKYIKGKIVEKNSPVVVFLPKSIDALLAFHGITFSGNIYVPVDISQPLSRIAAIFDILNPKMVITYENYIDKLKEICDENIIVNFNHIFSELSSVAETGYELIDKSISSDPLYILFTSGSTGVPKGVCISHQSVIDYIDWVCDTFKFEKEDRFANQAPFYFDNSILDIYSVHKTGASLYIIPPAILPYPVDVLKYLEDNEITVIFWVPSALISLANSSLLSESKGLKLKKVLFCGEIMPNKQLNIWRKAYPDLLYANLYGPTEITDVCTYYIVDREFSDDESLPIGKPCRNTDILILDDENKMAKKGDIGELCVRGISLSLGYYNNPEKTKAAFVQNPLNTHYDEIIYRTGDLVYLNEYDEIIFVGRKDFQIKHNGYRIELGEIETAASSIEGISNVCVLYNEKSSEITMFYVSDKEFKISELRQKLLTMIPRYEMPAKYYYLEKMPLTGNGKIDRQYLKRQMYGEI